MTKKDFLIRLEEKLSFLPLEERQKEIKKYNDLIDRYTLLSNEQEAVRQLGEVDDLVKIISLKKSYQVIKPFKQSVLKIKENFKSKDKKLIFKTIIKLFWILLIILFIKIPFIALRDLGYEYLSFIFNKTILESIWYYLFEILYLSVALLFGKKNLIKEFH